MAKQPARDYGIIFNDNPADGANNNIADIGHVCVGHAYYIGGVYYWNNNNNPATSSIHGNALNLQNGYINTGVTAILPLGNNPSQRRQNAFGINIDTFVPAAWFSLNGCGEMTGTTWIEESGVLEGPILLTHTAAVGTVRNAVIDYAYQYSKPASLDAFSLLLPVVAETYDGWLNDYLGVYAPNNYDAFKTAQDAIEYASQDGAQYQGSVGGGTAMTCYDWKGGIGTSSRPVDQNYSVGVLVQANQGTWDELVILGAPVGPVKKLEPKSKPEDDPPVTGSSRLRGRRAKSSIIVVIATNAPLLPVQLKRLARRGAIGIARTGTSTLHDSGEICIAFSTATNGFKGDAGPIGAISNEDLDPYFTATAAATEEAILNALIANEADFSTPIKTPIKTGNQHIGCAIQNAVTSQGQTFTKILQDYGRM